LLSCSWGAQAELSRGSSSPGIAGEQGFEGVTGGGHTVFLTHVAAEVPRSSRVLAILQQPFQFGCGALCRVVAPGNRTGDAQPGQTVGIVRLFAS